MILFSGGLIQELESGRKLFERTVPLDTVQRIWKIASQYDWHIQSYVDDHLLCHHQDWQSDYMNVKQGLKLNF